MPVKIERLSPSPYDSLSMSIFNDSDMFNPVDNCTEHDDHDSDFAMAISDAAFPSAYLSPEDLWESLGFIPTPPQSPPLKMDDQLSLNNDDKIGGCTSAAQQQKQALISHDCMWSGQCSEGLCRAKQQHWNHRPLCSNYNNSSLSSVFNTRPDTPFNLSTSPQNNFIIYDASVNVNDAEMEENGNETNQQHQTAAHQTQQCHSENNNNSQHRHNKNNNNNNAAFCHMANDHSYGGSSSLTLNTSTKINASSNGNSLIKKSQQHTNSLLNRNHKLEKMSQAKMTKVKCNTTTSKRISMQNKKCSNSLLNNVVDHKLNEANKNTIINGSRSTKENQINGQHSVPKPTIISVANFKNIQDNFQARYRVSGINVKRKQQQQKLNSFLDNSIKIEPIDDDQQLQQKPQTTTICSNVNRVKQQITTTSTNNINNAHHQHIINTAVVANNNKTNNINIAATSITQHSPACSDSEDNSSLSFCSGDNNLAGDASKVNAPPVKRREHNDSERKRRDHLRNSFNNLRDQVPKLKYSQKRPPRILILHEATTYVRELIDEHEQLENTLREEMEKRNRLLELLKRAENKN